MASKPNSKRLTQPSYRTPIKNRLILGAGPVLEDDGAQSSEDKVSLIVKRLSHDNASMATSTLRAFLSHKWQDVRRHSFH